LEQATPDRSRAAIERVVREEWGYTLATLVGRVRDFDLAEDVLQDAGVAALQHWPRTGVPENPRAWLLQTARRKAIDRFRRDARFDALRTEFEAQAERAEREGAEEAEETAVDERLSLIFTCCHPALGEQARVGLTLRTLGGLTTIEIARAFLVAETALAQRLVRAKKKIKAAKIPYRVPPPDLWPERLTSVLSVVYFIFNEGYSATSGERPTRADLCSEAIRLGRILVDLAPSEPEALGLLALMLLHDSRRGARTDLEGNLVTLEEQDRGRWNREAIREGDEFLRRALATRAPGPYQIQAAISAVHASADSYENTDWREIVGLYRALYDLQPSWVVRLNEAVAASYADGPQAGLDMLEGLDDGEAVERYQPYHAARADLLRRAGRLDEANAAYRRAIDLTRNEAERRFLESRLSDPGHAATKKPR
jgi:RNA polymerase sigma-70 factor (ECF subfamily)